MQKTNAKLMPIAMIILVMALVAGCASNAPVNVNSPVSTGDKTGTVLDVKDDTQAVPPVTAPVKEFTITSFTEVIDGKYHPQFSVKEITVNKGDLVRLKITATSGMHDFKLDEFNVYSPTPLNQETIIEFKADKAGQFTYYCNQPNHRANGQFGTLKVVE